jgi:uncharacterized repeat protein (TIGR01451 family)
VEEGNNMKNKILAILVCMLLIVVTSLVVAGQTIEVNQQERILPNEFLLTGEECNPSIDVEKYVWDPRYETWIDADTENEALNVKICEIITFKVVVSNVGDCPLFNITFWDTMTDGLKYINADPEPDNYSYEPPYYNMSWYFSGPLEPDQSFEIHIEAHVEGPLCSVDFNRAKAEGKCLHGILVYDEDYAYVHPKRWNEKEVNTPLLKFMQSHPYLFPLLQKLIQL